MSHFPVAVWLPPNGIGGFVIPITGSFRTRSCATGPSCWSWHNFIGSSIQTLGIESFLMKDRWVFLGLPTIFINGVSGCTLKRMVVCQGASAFLRGLGYPHILRIPYLSTSGLTRALGLPDNNSCFISGIIAMHFGSSGTNQAQKWKSGNKDGISTDQVQLLQLPPLGKGWMIFFFTLK